MGAVVEFLFALFALGLLWFLLRVGIINLRIRRVENFKTTARYISYRNFAGVAIDATRREILLVDTFTLRRFSMSSIISCEIFEDDVELVHIDRGSQFAGISAGGLLAGIGGVVPAAIGAVIGGLFASTYSTNNVHKLTLQFMTDDFERPYHEIVFLDVSYKKKGIERDSFAYRQALKKAVLWYGRVTAMIKAEESREKDMF